MGFFKSLKNKIGRTIGKAMEIVGEKTNMISLELAGMNLQDACSEVSKAIGEEEVFVAEEARAEDTTRINSALTEFSISLEKKADLVEKGIIQETNKYMNLIVSEIKKADLEIDINADRITIVSEKIESIIRGNIKKYISKKVSIDDEECSKILRMEAGNLKKVSMDNFSKKVLKEAITLYTKDIENLVSEQNSVLKSAICGKIEDLKVNTEKHLSQLEEFEKANNNSEEKEALIQSHMGIVLLCDKVEEYLI